jgi:hypothetical protein
MFGSRFRDFSATRNGYLKTAAPVRSPLKSFRFADSGSSKERERPKRRSVTDPFRILATS